jgi:alkaline phosphatase
MNKTIRKRIISTALFLTMSLSVLNGCTSTKSVSELSSTTTSSIVIAEEARVEEVSFEEAKKPKYIFLFIGDGMSYVQTNAAQVYLGNNTAGEIATASLNFTQFPVIGNVTTYDSTSFCPDSASTATALSCGVKTHSGVVGLEADKLTQPESVTEILKQEGMKIGVVSTVTINHATPAAFYSHVVSRNDYYKIAMQLATSEVDYFGGGSVNKSTGSDGSYTDAYSIIEKKGYTIADTNEEILALDSTSGKCYALSPVLQDSGSMSYAIDAGANDLTFADYVSKGIEVLDNENGFFMVCESGKIDWACHANDAMTTIQEVIDFSEGVQSAIDFAAEHPDETLILVTGDHETGGMTIGYASTGYDTAFNLLGKQTMSYVAFDELVGEMKEANPDVTLDDFLPVIKDAFGLIAPSDPDAAIEANADFVMTDYEFEKLEKAFAESMLPEEERSATEETSVLYGGYDPLSVTLTHIINNKAGVGWTSYSHTGTPVAFYAMGASAELFAGTYDNTEVFYKMLEAAGYSSESISAA